MGYKGNKSFLPKKNRAVCGLAMVWRKKWQKAWEEVKYCSDKCRKIKSAARPQSHLDETSGQDLLNG